MVRKVFRTEYLAAKDDGGGETYPGDLGRVLSSRTGMNQLSACVWPLILLSSVSHYQPMGSQSGFVPDSNVYAFDPTDEEPRVLSRLLFADYQGHGSRAEWAAESIDRVKGGAIGFLRSERPVSKRLLKQQNSVPLVCTCC